MSLFDDLLAQVRPAPAPPCLILGCDGPRTEGALCARHNRDVNEPDPLEGVEVAPIPRAKPVLFRRSDIPDPVDA